MNSLETAYSKHTILTVVLWLKDLKGKAMRKTGKSDFTQLCDEYAMGLNDAYHVVNQTELLNIALKSENEFLSYKVNELRQENERLEKVLNHLKERV